MTVIKILICLVLGHKPALVTQPCRCLCCEQMIQWKRDGAGWGTGWEFADEVGWRKLLEDN